jgi:16S rRNA (cytosine1402-N4)-methyltransferase
MTWTWKSRGSLMNPEQRRRRAMNAAPQRPHRHIPVLAEPVLHALRPRPGQTVVDCTLGLGGHARLLLERIMPGGKLIAIDFDPHNIESARAQFADAAAGTFSLRHTNFAGLPGILADEGIERADAILADLGVASPQIDDPARGFSYRRPGPLDMRMDPTRGQPAAALVNRMSERELADALLTLGDEEDAADIARLIVQRRRELPILTTQDLTRIVCDARHFTLERAAGAKLHPAARTFQALRMLVNREPANLQRLLAVLPQCLKPGGRAAIISFHSGEDRLVKQSFRAHQGDGAYSRISDEPIVADESEIRANPRSRSAKLRWAERSPNAAPMSS